MEKEIGQINVIETDDGYRVDIKGKGMREFMSCCGPVVLNRSQSDSCCSEGKSVQVKCCSEDKEK